MSFPRFFPLRVFVCALITAGYVVSEVPTGTTPIKNDFAGGLVFVPVTPCRVADTRANNGAFGQPFMAGNTTRIFPVASSSCGIPSGAQAYALNITVVPHQPLFYLTLWPTGQPQPVVSTLNSPDGRIVANAAIVPAGTNGSISVYVTDPTDVIIDINGYFMAAGGAAGLSFYTLTPCRVVDTRGPNGQFGGPILTGNVPRFFTIPQGPCAIPSTAQAYSFNATVVPPGPLLYLTLWPGDQPQPTVSTLNAPTGAVVANAAIVPGAARAGEVDAYVSDASHLILDINGYFAPSAGSSALQFNTVAPCRIADTRNAAGPFGGPLMSGGSIRTFTIPQSPCGLPAGAQAYSLNMTVVPRHALSYLTTWPAGQNMPVVSTLNSGDGRIVANAAIVPAGTNGAINVFVTDDTDVIIDVNGYFSFPSIPAPSITAVYPANQSTGIPLNSGIVVQFNTAIDPASISSDNVTLTGNTPVAGTSSVSDDGLYLVFTPNTQLQPSTTYTLSVSGIHAAQGSAPSTAFTSTFVTGTSPDSIPATVTGTISGTASVPTNAVFNYQSSKRLNPASLRSNFLMFVDQTSGGAPIPASVHFAPDGLSFSVTPRSPFAVGNTYAISPSPNDIFGHNISLNLNFTVGFAARTQGPQLLTTIPRTGDSGVPLNTAPSLVFDEAISPLSTGKIQMLSSGQPIPVNVTLNSAGTGVTLTPTGLLSANTSYTIAVSGQIADEAGNLLQNPTTITFTTGSSADVRQPQLMAVSPLNMQSSVPTNTSVQVLLSKPANPATVDNNALFLMGINSQRVAGAVTLSPDGLVLTFTPSNPLTPNTNYNLTTGGFTDLSGTTFADSLADAFKTGSGPDTTAPSVVSSSPAQAAAGMPVNAVLDVLFSEAMNPVTILRGGTVTLTSGSTPVPATISANATGTGLNIKPLAVLLPSTTYTYRLTGLTDLAGNQLPAFSSSFTTSASPAPDTTRPTVVSVSPADMTSGVALNAPVTITFSEPIDPTTASGIVFLAGPVSPFPGSYAVSGATVTFTPQSAWPPNTSIVVGVPTSVTDLAANTLANGFTSSFTTVAGGDTTPPAVTSVTPTDGSTGLGPSTVVVLTFSEPLNPGTVSANSVGLFNGNAALTPFVELSQDARTISLSAFALPAPANLTVVVTHDIKDLAGNSMTEFRSSFSTVAVDNSVPTVVTQRPGPAATGVPANSPITLVLNKPIDGASLNGALHVSQNGSLVAGAVSLVENGFAIRFVPQVPFQNGAVIQTFLDNTVRDTNGNIPTRYQSSFTIGDSPNATFALGLASPGIDTLIPTNSVFDISFTLDVDATTINGTNVQLRTGGTVVPATVALLSPRSVRVTPLSPLAPNTSYFLAISTAVHSAQGASLAGGSLSYTTASGPDSTVPAILQVVPSTNSGNVGTNSLIRVQFNKLIDPVTVNGNTVTILAAGAPLSASFSLNADGRSVTATPYALLPDSSTITVTVNGVRDIVGNTFPQMSFTFSTGTSVDVINPTRLASSIPQDATVPVNSPVVLMFSEPIDSFSFGDSTCSVLTNDGIRLAGTYSVSADALTAMFVPSQPFPVHQNITFNCAGIQDLAGNQLPFTQSFLNFSTSFAADTTPPTVLATNPDNGMTGAPLNAQIQVLFSEPVQATSLGGITLSSGSGRIAITPAASGSAVTILTANFLTPNTAYTVSVSGVRDLAGNVLSAPTSFTFTTGNSTDLAIPIATSNIAPGATNVPLNTPIRFAYSERMSRTSILLNVLLERTNAPPIPPTPVPTTVAIAADGLSATITPGSPLEAGRTYTLFYRASDVAGNPVAFAPSLGFMMGTAPDSGTPSVASISPADGSTNVPLNAVIDVQFNKSIDRTTAAGSVVVMTAGLPIAGSTAPLGSDTIRFTPANRLAANATYTVRVSGISDLSGHPAPQFMSSFSTSAAGAIDTTRPQAISVSPANNATGVAPNAAIAITYSEPVDGPSVEAAVTVMTLSGVTIQGTATAAGSVVTFTPAQPLPGNTTLGVRATGVADLVNNLSGTFTSQFSTGPGADTTAPVVTSVTPVNGATNQSVGTSVVLTFSKPIDPTTETLSSLAVLSGVTRLSVGFSRSPDGMTVTMPNLSLSPSTTYTVVATHEITDLSGNHLVDFSSQFTTSAFTGSQPGVLSQVPANGATGVPANSQIVLTFGGPMLVSTLAGAFHVAQNGAVVNGSVQVPDSQTITFTPAAPFLAGAVVQVFVDTTAEDANGIPATSYSGQFTVAGSASTPNLQVERMSPSSRLLTPNAVLEFGFTQALDAGLVNAGNVTLSQGAAAVPARVSLRKDRIVRIEPLQKLDAAQYTVRFGADLGGQEFSLAAVDEGVSAAPAIRSVERLAGGRVRIHFSAPINPLTVDAQSVQVVGADGSSFSFSQDDTVLDIAPYVTIAPGDVTVRLNGTVEGLDGRRTAARSITLQARQ